MSKRKLNKQQRSRIASNQAAVSDNADRGDLSFGLVVTHYGKEVEVLELDSDKRIASQTTQRCHFRAKLPTIVCGDRVLWKAPPEGEATGVIEALLERRSLLKRPRPYQDPKPVAANIDTIFITLAPSPEPITSLIDRFLIAAENADIAACLLLNKQDLMDSNPTVAQEIEKLIEVYTELGYPVYRYCAADNETTQQNDASSLAFLDALKNKTSILVGQSGVGKSSIINALAGNHDAKIGDVSSATDKGRHTTTTSQLYQLFNHGLSSSSEHKSDQTIANDNKADIRFDIPPAISSGISLDSSSDNDDSDSITTSIIDSPGIREFGLWHLSQDDIINGMAEFQRFSMECKFRDCEHGKSAGCALQLAIEQGDIHPSRASSYHHILDSLDD